MYTTHWYTLWFLGRGRQLSQIGGFNEQLELLMDQPADMMSAQGFDDSDGPCYRTGDIQATFQTHKCWVAKLDSGEFPKFLSLSPPRNIQT